MCITRGSAKVGSREKAKDMKLTRVLTCLVTLSNAIYPHIFLEYQVYPFFLAFF